ncbi:hypothetical protein PYH37_000018 [Sinorhizobium numidicum]|uniref:Uncharacterized protein n=1 Tax=Sinorhizobium numidicum TaxID=680248 RepID=A0ABY8CUR7_9HYPH|nr:hypothetical protein [Sinorhizobium numidicum]WEX74750.1 hypothetical protein PYH37_000018 [Sinorhizobium numidicum]WEX80741.1 hypothetical protein PYH38_000020 [Sinorhizobium numidicum]
MRPFGKIDVIECNAPTTPKRRRPADAAPRRGGDRCVIRIGEFDMGKGLVRGRGTIQSAGLEKDYAQSELLAF